MPIGIADPIAAVPRAHVRALREPELPRMVGLLRRQRLRRPSRARIQRDPQRRGADRRLAALQIPRHRRRRRALVDRLITRDVEDGGRPGLLHAVVRRARQGDRRRHGVAAGRDAFRWTAADPSLRWFRQNAAGLDVTIEDISEEVAALALQGPTSARLLRAVSDGRHRPLKYFRVTSGHDRRRSASTSRAPDTPAISATRSGCRAARRPGVGCADGGRQAVRHQAGRHAGARRGARRSGPAAHRRRFLQQQEGADRVADLHPTRWASAGWSASTRPLHRPAGAARASTRRARAADRRPGDRLERGRTDLRAPGPGAGVGATASRVAVPVYKAAKQVGKATTTTWSPVLKRMIALATVDRPHYAEGTGSRSR